MRALSTDTYSFDQETLQRVCGEFLEMPGLNLTCRQARRLWGLDEAACLHLLEFLVDERFLYRRHDHYARLTEGRVAIPRPRMAKAEPMEREKDARRNELSA